MASGSIFAELFERPGDRVDEVLEIAVMVLGTVALFTQSFPFMLGLMFLMSVQSTIFSPAKYSSLPELLPEWRLSWGNGFFGLGTFFAIIAGGVLAGVASAQLGRWRDLEGGDRSDRSRRNGNFLELSDPADSGGEPGQENPDQFRLGARRLT